MYKFHFQIDWICPALLALFVALLYLSCRYFPATAIEMPMISFVIGQVALVICFARFFYEGAKPSQQAKAGLTMLFLAMLLGALGNLMTKAAGTLPGLFVLFSWVQLSLMYAGAAVSTLALYRLDKLPKESQAAPQPQSACGPQAQPELQPVPVQSPEPESTK